MKCPVKPDVRFRIQELLIGKEMERASYLRLEGVTSVHDVGTETGFGEVSRWSHDLYPVQKYHNPDSETEFEGNPPSSDITFLGREVRPIYRSPSTGISQKFSHDLPIFFLRLSRESGHPQTCKIDRRWSVDVRRCKEMFLAPLWVPGPSYHYQNPSEVQSMSIPVPKNPFIQPQARESK